MVKPDLTIVYPNNRTRSYGSLMTLAAVTMPIQVGVTASFIRQRGYSVNIIDAEASNLNTEQTAEKIAAIGSKLTLIATDNLNSGDVTKIAAASELLKELRQKHPKIRTVLEGTVPTAYPEKMLREECADLVCQGESYYPVLELLKAMGPNIEPENLDIKGICYLKDGKFVSNGRWPLMQNLDDLPYASWDLLPMDKYRAHHWHCFDNLGKRQPYASIYTNLGCPYDCSFCAVNVVYGGPGFRQRSPENVLGEIDLLVEKYKVRNIRIVDNTFTVRMDFVEKFCDLIIKRNYNLNMWCYARAETIKSFELLQKMKKAGINWVAYGFESAVEKVRSSVHKGANDQPIEKAIEMTKKADINIVGNFIFGLPEDDMKTMQATYDIAGKYNFEWVNFYTAMAYPGTKLYDYALKSNIKLPGTWSGYGQYSEDALPMSTKYLSSAEVLRFRDNAFQKYYTDPAYISFVGKKFGQEAENFVREMVKHDVHRNILQEETKGRAHDTR